MDNKGWWDKVEFDPNVNMGDWYDSFALKEACQKGITYFTTNISGYVEEGPQKIFEIIEKFGAKLTKIIIIPENVGTRYYTTPTIFISFHRYDLSYYNVDIRALNLKDISKLADELGPLFKKVPFTGTVKMLSSNNGGYAVLDVGKLNTPLVKKNYTDKTVQQFEHLKEELTSSKPCGRFSLLTGPPGTGKSFFLRGLITEVAVNWLFIPSSLVGGLSGPDLARVLFSQVENEEDKVPTVIIIEDADSCIRKRTEGNFNQLSDILNLGDGILGELADLRILATTNSKNSQLDEAITRPGRLCSLVNFEALTAVDYKKMFKDLTDKDMLYSPAETERTLAHLYRDARNSGWKDPSGSKIVKSIEGSKSGNGAVPSIAGGNYI